MSYIKAEDVLPRDIIEIIQKYIDGQNIYIPKKSDTRTKWAKELILYLFFPQEIMIFTPNIAMVQILNHWLKSISFPKKVFKELYTKQKLRANPERVCSSFFIKIYEVVFHNNIKYNYTIKYLKGRRYNGFN